MAWLSDPQAWIGFVTLAVLEIVLGIDNIIFISILAGVLVQIILLDIVFSLDSVITAVGMVDDIGVMIAAVVVAVLFMMVFARPVGEFVERHPTVKMLALAFLLMIGVALIAEGRLRGDAEPAGEEGGSTPVASQAAVRGIGRLG